MTNYIRSILFRPLPKKREKPLKVFEDGNNNDNENNLNLQDVHEKSFIHRFINDDNNSHSRRYTNQFSSYYG